ncbi:MAG: hypothetical protein D6824_02535 [Planctomycetota bacterium]|nr:MAG: hypothetical protein D6824_02535 [Planctomycetota bacterium]
MDARGRRPRAAVAGAPEPTRAASRGGSAAAGAAGRPAAADAGAAGAGRLHQPEPCAVRAWASARSDDGGVCAGAGRRNS